MSIKKMLKLIPIVALSLIFVINCISVHAVEKVEQHDNKVSVLDGYKRQKIDVNMVNETEIMQLSKTEIPCISSNSERLLKVFEKDISEIKEVKKIQDNVLNRKVTRIILNDAEIDFDNAGNIVAYKNLDDFSKVDKGRKKYSENQMLPEIKYQIKNSRRY